MFGETARAATARAEARRRRRLLRRRPPASAKAPAGRGAERRPRHRWPDVQATGLGDTRSAASGGGRHPVPRRRSWRLPAVVALSAALTAVAGAAWWCWPGEAVLDLVRTADQNVLIVTMDTLRADALGCYGGRGRTPNLDRLAADGVRFDFAHAHAVLTLPSHVSILSGLYPFEHGVRDNSGYRVAPRTMTAATLLKSEGFATAAFIGGYPLDSQFGLDAGLRRVRRSARTTWARRRNSRWPSGRQTRSCGRRPDLARRPARHVVRVGARLRSARAHRPPEPYATRVSVEPLRGRGGRSPTRRWGRCSTRARG